MATRKPKPTVTLAHPSGKFTVAVPEARAHVLEQRGYTRVEPAARRSAASPAKADKE